MRRASLILLFLLAVSGARADDQISAAQQALKEQGFYYGEVDGQMGTETSAAIRRYQIRSGLEVTGALNQETLSSLKSGGGAAPARPAAQSTPYPQSREPSVSEADRKFLEQQAAQTPAPPPAPAATPRERYVGSVLPAPAAEQAAPPPGADFGAFYAHTPYETAPEEVQVETLKRAQERLFRYGYYRDAVDGIPGPATERSLFFFQQNAGLSRTGRLDMDTLAALRLLPGRGEVFAPRPAPAPAPAPYGAPLRGSGFIELPIMNARRVGVFVCLCVLALAGCATASKKAKQAAMPPPHRPQVVGTVALVNSKLGFVLVDVRAFEYPGVGVALESFAEGKQTAILMVSPEKNRPFIIADIVKGTPGKGDIVYQ